MNGDPRLYSILHDLGIPFEYHEHPPAPTIEIAMQYWKDIVATHCKNIFFRNHKGDRHYLVVLDHRQELGIHDLEKRLKQGKLTFASQQRLMNYLGVAPGSVSPYDLINDSDHHVRVFFDENLKNCEKISFHPCINTASIIVNGKDFWRFMQWTGNDFEFIRLYD
ncbi:MAG TPA: prolyl-tRNA synthetase associated domain-containing protein [Bacteroidales bacterium]|nr:prolyl-tRNA synthetase associated domain-containing protein [Bacteroidales bacterium]HPT02287.1 prolyl-tRNA synthetase associated domain-containing protein [Bacteroidales bacterium]